MTVSKKNKNLKSKTLDEVVSQETDVLYQRIGNKWYSFCVVNDEVFMGELSEEMLNETPNTSDTKKEPQA